MFLNWFNLIWRVFSQEINNWLVSFSYAGDAFDCSLRTTRLDSWRRNKEMVQWNFVCVIFFLIKVTGIWGLWLASNELDVSLKNKMWKSAQHELSCFLSLSDKVGGANHRDNLTSPAHTGFLKLYSCWNSLSDRARLKITSRLKLNPGHRAVNQISCSLEY